MTNMEKYKAAFAAALDMDVETITEDLEYQGIPAWDSIGHMELISQLEDTFDIMMETDDIVDLSSFKVGMEILGKYEISFE